MNILNKNIMLLGVITLMIVFIGILGMQLHSQDRLLHDFVESEPQYCKQDSDCILFSPCDGYTQYSISKQNIRRYTMLGEQYCKQNYSTFADVVNLPAVPVCKNRICIKEFIDSYYFYFIDEEDKPVSGMTVKCTIDNPAGVPSQLAIELTENAKIYDTEGLVFLTARNHGFQGFDDVICHFYHQQKEVYKSNYSQFERKFIKVRVTNT